VASAVAWTSLIASATASAQPACGPDQATALQTFLAQQLREPQTDEPWAGVPIDSNYDPCADLSTILVTIEKATGSSPVQALMFNRGIYVGPATWKAYGFTTLNRALSTPDMVVLDYKTPGECNACPPAAIDSVRFQWRGGHVETLDPLPPV
jgi:LppP/LprE lipoprotein